MMRQKQHHPTQAKHYTCVRSLQKVRQHTAFQLQESRTHKQAVHTGSCLPLWVRRGSCSARMLSGGRQPQEPRPARFMLSGSS